MTLRSLMFGAAAMIAASAAPHTSDAAVIGSSNLGNLSVGQTGTGFGILYGSKFFGEQLPDPLSDLSDNFTFSAGNGVTGYTATLTAATVALQSPPALGNLGAILTAAINNALNNLNPTNLGGYKINTTSVNLGQVASFAGLQNAVNNVVASALGPIAIDPIFGAGAGAIYYQLTVTAVPLPAAGILLASALGGLGLMRRRAKAATTA